MLRLLVHNHGYIYHSKFKHIKGGKRWAENFLQHPPANNLALTCFRLLDLSNNNPRYKATASTATNATHPINSCLITLIRTLETYRSLQPRRQTCTKHYSPRSTTTRFPRNTGAPRSTPWESTHGRQVDTELLGSSLESEVVKLEYTSRTTFTTNFGVTGR